MQDVYRAEWRPRDVTARRTVDLSAYPEMVVMYIGMRVNKLSGIPTVLRFAKRVDDSLDERPEGLLFHERLVFSPRQIGWRQYWRDVESLGAWSRREPHRRWWTEYLRKPGGAGLWHETYFMRGGMEALYDAMPEGIGLSAFAATLPAEGTMFAQRMAKPRSAGAPLDVAAPEAADDSP